MKTERHSCTIIKNCNGQVGQVVGCLQIAQEMQSEMMRMDDFHIESENAKEGAFRLD